MKRILFLLLLAIVSPSWSATITAAAGGGNWSNTATWVGAATPTAADDVLLAVTSGSVTVDVGTAVSKSVTATAFVNNLNFSAGQTLTVSGNVQLDTVVSGMTISGTGVLSVNATANLLSAGQTFTGSLLLGVGGTFTYTLADNWTVSKSLLTANSITLNGNSINVGGDLLGTVTAAVFNGTTAINLNGSGQWNYLINAASASNAFIAGSSSVTINTSGTVTLGTIIDSTGIYTYTAGTIVNTNNYLYLTASTTINSGAMHWNNINILNSAVGTYTINSNLILDGTLSFGYIVVNPPLTVPVNQTISGAFNATCANLSVAQNVRARFSAGQTITVSNSIKMFQPGFGSLVYAAGAKLTKSPQLASATASSSIFLKYTGSCGGSLIFNSDFTDVDASASSAPLTVYSDSNGPVLTRTVNIVTGTFTGQNCSSTSPKGFY